ncbi:MAG TPA: efflux RND transporter permease subunit, partial [Polyangiaceae bacterium]|nr:efflux RND transporter permease subunit [Polyangiaceae bacterium]
SSVAEVVEGASDRMVRIGGPRGETVGVSVARLPGASTPDVVRGAMVAVAALRPSLPAGVHVDPVYDQAALVTESMASVRDAIVLGILLCGAVIGLFLRDPRAGALAGVSVPVTLAISFVLMRLAHQTLNLMSLGGMAVSVGLVVDDAIVMVEAIARRRDLGDEPGVAAARGTGELAPAVIGTTLTTVVVFVPLAFLDGVVGDFFRALAFTLTTAVLVSLAVALVLVPVAATRALAARKQANGPSRLDAAYDRVLGLTLGRAWLAPVVLCAVLAAGALVAPRLGRGFLPTMDEGAFVLDYFLPAGTSLESTEVYARSIEAELSATPEVLTFARRTGAELGPATATQAYRGDIMVRLRPRSERERSVDDVIADLRERTARKVPEARVEFVQVLQDVLNDLAGNPRPIEVKVFGPDYAKLHAVARDIASRAEHVPGVVDLYDGQELAVPELRFAVNRDAAARFGVTADDLQSELDTALHGQVVGSLQRFDRLIGVRTRYPNPVRYDRARVLDLPLARGERISTFRAVADIRGTASEAALLHEGLQPMVAVTADHEDRDLGSVADDVDAVAKATPLPPGYRVVLGGQAEAERATLGQLVRVGAIAVLLVLTVLAAQFRRLRTAALVLATIPVAVLGGLLALWVTQTPLNASSLMGSVLLVGLVVKNGVLLLEEAERRVEIGEPPREAVREAGLRRVRPIVMTTLATLAGLAPLALGVGAGAELQRPLALTVIGGLITSTLATLVLLPPAAVVLLRRRAQA